jgi:hypothetical protein
MPTWRLPVGNFFKKKETDNTQQSTCGFYPSPALPGKRMELYEMVVWSATVANHQCKSLVIQMATN